MRGSSVKMKQKYFEIFAPKNCSLTTKEYATLFLGKKKKVN